MWCELEGLFAAADRMLLSKRRLYLLVQVSEPACANWRKTTADDITRVMSPVCTVCHAPQGQALAGPCWPPCCEQQQWLCGHVREICTWQTQFLHTDSKSGAGEEVWENQWEWQLEKVIDNIGRRESNGVGGRGTIDEVVHNGDGGSQEDVQGMPSLCVLHQLLARGTLYWVEDLQKWDFEGQHTSKTQNRLRDFRSDFHWLQTGFDVLTQFPEWRTRCFSLPLTCLHCVHLPRLSEALRFLQGAQKELRRNRTDFVPCLMEQGTHKLLFLLAGSLPHRFIVAVDFSSELCPLDLKWKQCNWMHHHSGQWQKAFFWKHFPPLLLKDYIWCYKPASLPVGTTTK